MTDENIYGNFESLYDFTKIGLVDGAKTLRGWDAATCAVKPAEAERAIHEAAERMEIAAKALSSLVRPREQFEREHFKPTTGRLFDAMFAIGEVQKHPKTIDPSRYLDKAAEAIWNRIVMDEGLCFTQMVDLVEDERRF